MEYIQEAKAVGHVCIWMHFTSRATDFSVKPVIQPACMLLSKEENRKEYVERKVQIHHYYLSKKKKKMQHVLWLMG